VRNSLTPGSAGRLPSASAGSAAIAGGQLVPSGCRSAQAIRPRAPRPRPGAVGRSVGPVAGRGRATPGLSFPRWRLHGGDKARHGGRTLKICCGHRAPPTSEPNHLVRRADSCSMKMRPTCSGGDGDGRQFRRSRGRRGGSARRSGGGCRRERRARDARLTPRLWGDERVRLLIHAAICCNSYARCRLAI